MSSRNRCRLPILFPTLLDRRPRLGAGTRLGLAFDRADDLPGQAFDESRPLVIPGVDFACWRSKRNLLCLLGRRSVRIQW
jgi:hypothetical protein